MPHGSPRSFSTRCVRIALASAALFVAAHDVASAQLSRVSPAGLEPSTTVVSPGVVRGTHVAFDPANNVYLLVGGNGALYGVFVNTLGQPVTGAFALPANGYFPSTVYSSETNGGAGGFLVAWNGDGATSIQTTVVAYPGGVVPGTHSALPSGGIWVEQSPAVAYSPASDRFLVAWTTSAFGIKGHALTAAGAPLGGVLDIETSGAQFPSLAWNASTNAFGLAFAGFGTGEFAGFRTINAANGSGTRTTFGFTTSGTFATGVAVNSYNGNFVMSWHQGGLDTRAILFDANGGTLASGPVMTGVHNGQDNLGVAFNPNSGTFLVVGSKQFGSPEVIGVELNADGAPVSSPTQLTEGSAKGSFHPRVAYGAGTWNVTYGRDFTSIAGQIIGTSSTGGGAPGSLGAPPSGGGGTTPPPPPPPPPTGCSTPDPFTAIGGGTCVNGGWVPSGSSGGTTTGGCATPQPAAGWTCVNGGWLPPTTGGTSTGGCSTPDPFASIGGGTCVNGGWLPGGGGSTSGGCSMASPGAGWTCVNGGWLPPSGGGGSTGGCSTPDPFASIGGGTCVNGGWLPGGGGSTSGGCSIASPGAGWTCVNGGWLPPSGGGGSTGGCSTPDPFASIGGGTCVNGGWTPGGSGASGGCSTPDPFAAIGGGTCVNGGWLPGGSGASSGGCTTPDPFISIGGGVCIAGGWRPNEAIWDY